MKNQKGFVVTWAICAIFILVMVLLCGCGHNIHVHGIGLATPYFAFGSGDFSCVKDNVEVENTETVKADGTLDSKQKFKVGKQTTGYDVDLNRSAK